MRHWTTGSAVRARRSFRSASNPGRPNVQSRPARVTAAPSWAVGGLLLMMVEGGNTLCALHRIPFLPCTARLNDWSVGLNEGANPESACVCASVTATNAASEWFAKHSPFDGGCVVKKTPTSFFVGDAELFWWPSKKRPLFSPSHTFLCKLCVGCTSQGHLVGQVVAFDQPISNRARAVAVHNCRLVGLCGDVALSGAIKMSMLHQPA